MDVDDLKLIYTFNNSGVHSFYFIGQLKVNYHNENNKDIMIISNDPNSLEKMSLEVVDMKKSKKIHDGLYVRVLEDEADELCSAIEFFKEPGKYLEESGFGENSKILLKFIKGVIYR